MLQPPIEPTTHSGHSCIAPIISLGHTLVSKYEKLIETWIRYQHKEDPPEDDPDFWSYCDFSDLIQEKPEDAWLIILEILSRDNSETIVEILSAGPLEDLLATHGDGFIDRVEGEARKNPQFASLLGGVWQNAMSDELYSRVRSAWNRSEWDGS